MEGFSPEREQMAKQYAAENKEEGFEVEIDAEVSKIEENRDEIIDGLSKIDPEKLTPSIKDRFVNAGSLLVEVALASGGLTAMGSVVLETFRNMGPGNTVYDNPVMFYTFFTGELVVAVAGIMEHLRQNRKDKFS